jgi:hypothetical protein
MQNRIVKKGFILGCIAFIICTGYVPSSAAQAEINPISDSAFTSNVTVTITGPVNGIYWNTRLIFPFDKPLILRGVIPYSVEIETFNGVEIDYLEMYFNDVLQHTDDAPPFEWFAPHGKMFSKFNWGLVVYTTDGSMGSDDITIWRIFR